MSENQEVELTAQIATICSIALNVSFFIYMRIKGIKLKKEQDHLNQNILKISEIENDMHTIKKLSKIQLKQSLGLDDLKQTDTINELQQIQDDLHKPRQVQSVVAKGSNQYQQKRLEQQQIKLQIQQ